MVTSVISSNSPHMRIDVPTLLLVFHNNSQRTTHRMDKAPNGIWSSFPALLAVVAWMFSLSSSCVCSFVYRTVTLVEKIEGGSGGESGTTNLGGSDLPVELLKNQGIGFWGWKRDRKSVV